MTWAARLCCSLEGLEAEVLHARLLLVMVAHSKRAVTRVLGLELELGRLGHCHLVVGKGGGCGIAHTGRVGAAIVVHVKLLLHVVVSGVVRGKERGSGLVGQVAVGVVGCGPVDALVARVALSLVGVDAGVGIQLAVCRVAGSIRHGIWQGRDGGVLKGGEVKVGVGGAVN